MISGEPSGIEDYARRALDGQPFSRLLRTELVSASVGSAELALDLRDDLTQQHGFAHGGIVSYLADNAITFAGGLAYGSDALTSEFKINYLRPAVGTRLVARASTKSKGKRQAVCVCEVFAVAEGVEKLCALAQGTVLPVT